MTDSELKAMERRLVELSERYVKTRDDSTQIHYMTLHAIWVEEKKKGM